MGIRRLGRATGRLIGLTAALWMATLLVLSLTVALWPADQALPAPADAIICLGAGMSQTAGWDQPDAASARRAQTCAALYAGGVAPVVVFTGYGHEIQSAAGAMFQTAVAAGLPPEAGRVEPHARSTIQNADFGLDMVPEARRVVLVSDAFHLPRSWMIFRAFGVTDVAVYATEAGFGPTDPALGGRTMAHWTLREASAIWFNALRATAYLVGGLIGIDHDTRIGWFT